MSSYAGGSDVAPVDRLTNAIRRLLEAALPWYDPDEAQERRRETERVRMRSIAARIHVEQIVAAYKRADGAIRR